MLNIPQQFTETIKRAHRVLIVFANNGDGDAIASSLALALALGKMGKHEVAVVAQDFIPPKNLSFLPRLKTIQSSLAGLRKFTIELSTKNVKLKDFSYDVADDALRIFLTPKEGFFRPEDIKSSASPFAYDCIVTINTPDLPSLGDVYTKHTEFFHATPTIAIDHDPAHEQYAQINIVDVTAAATGEMLFTLLPLLGIGADDKELATYLLTAIIAKTKSFRTPRITPRILETTGKLIAHGADRERIMENLYRTRSVATLQLWGRVLARLTHDADRQFAWSALAAADFERTGATAEHLPDIVDELLQSAPHIKTTLLLYEETTTNPIMIGTTGDRPVVGILCTTPPYSAIDICRAFNPTGAKERAHFRLPTHSLREAEKEVVEKIRMQLMTTAR